MVGNNPRSRIEQLRFRLGNQGLTETGRRSLGRARSFGR
jgi:hypothetical protein